MLNLTRRELNLIAKRLPGSFDGSLLQAKAAIAKWQIGPNPEASLENRIRLQNIRAKAVSDDDALELIDIFYDFLQEEAALDTEAWGW